MMQMDNKEKANEQVQEEDGMTLMQLLHIVKMRFWIVILCVIVAIGCACAYLYVTVPTYESSASALVSPIQNATSLDSLLGSSSSSSKIQTEVSLISSEKNVDKALALLNLHDYMNEDGVHYDEFEHPITGRSLVKGSKVTVSTVKDTNVVSITVSDSSPEFCQDLANALVQSFSEVLTTIAKNSKTAQRVFLEEQIPLNEASLAEATKKLADFKQKSGILQISEKNKLLSSNVSTLQLQEEPLMHQQVEQKSLYEGYRNELAANGFKISSIEDFSGDEMIVSTLEKIFGWYQEVLMYQALGLSDEGSSSSSRLYVLQSSISNGQKDILSAVSSVLKTQVVSSDSVTVQLRNLYAQSIVQLLMIQKNLESIDDTKTYYMNELSQYPELERQAEELSRTVNVYQTLGVKLREMYEETKLLEAAISGYVTPIDSANLPARPVSPNKLLILAVSVLLGGCLGVLIVLYVNHRDIAIHDSSEAKEILGPHVPELGWIPLLNQSYRDKYGSQLVTLCAPNSFASERVSVIASNTIYSTDPSKMKIIGVNSSSKGEGKTSLVCNLAVAYAEMGKKVLLIDGDLRRPSTERAFGLKKAERGVSDLVISNADLVEVLIRPVKGLENLHMLCSGHVTRNPAVIFNSQAFKNFLLASRDNYDIVLVDSPPVSVSPEFASIVSYSDGIIMNIRAGITTKPDLELLVDNLHLIDSTIIGFVYNGVIASGKRTSYSYSGTGRYSYDKSNYNGKRRSSDLKMLVRAKRVNRTYRKVYEKELKSRDEVFNADKLEDPVYLEDLIAGADQPDQQEPIDSVAVQEPLAEHDPLADIENDSEASGKAPEEK